MFGVLIKEIADFRPVRGDTIAGSWAKPPSLPYQERLSDLCGRLGRNGRRDSTYRGDGCWNTRKAPIELRVTCPQGVYAEVLKVLEGYDCRVERAIPRRRNPESVTGGHAQGCPLPGRHDPGAAFGKDRHPPPPY